MPLTTLICAGLLGYAGDGHSSAAEVAAAYRQVEASARRTPDDQIRLALWCEARGLTAERVRHLALAVLADPTNATARGLLGLVARDGRWVAPDVVAQTVQADPASTALLAEYDRKRAQTPYKADDQWALGLWADEQGLKDQARAHFTAVTRLDPNRDVAWKRLGYKKHDGFWATDAQLAAAKAEAEAQRQGDRIWKPQLERWRVMLGQPARQEEVQAAFLGVTDPRAVRAISQVLGNGTEPQQRVAAQLFGQIKAPEASLGLASLAIWGKSAEVRRVALEILALRDPREFVGALVSLIRTPWKYEVRPVNGPGSVGELFVEGDQYNIRRLFTPPSVDESRWANQAPVAPPLAVANAEDPNYLRLWILNQANYQKGLLTPNLLASTSQALVDYSYLAVAQRGFQIQQSQQRLMNDAQRAQDALNENIRSVEAANAAIHQLNERVLPVLGKVTGQKLGESQEAWSRWNIERAGYAFQASTSEKPTFSEVVPLEYASVQPRHSCFAAGTQVRTIDGMKTIETIRHGDQVLVQDTISGALSYQPVLTAFHNPPSATYQIKLGDDLIRATGIHRFWQAGKGWTMARDLKVGDTLRVIGGVATVEAVTTEATEPVFNLEVAEGRSFFVGRVGALVHDNSLVEATPNPFDAPRSAVAIAPTSDGH